MHVAAVETPRLPQSRERAGGAGAGRRGPARGQRRRQDEPAGGRLLRARRPLVPGRQRPGHDRASTSPRRGSSWSWAATTGTLLSALDRNGERRHSLDGRPLRGAGERPLVSVFHPDRMELVKGPAARRRGHLDRRRRRALARPRRPAQPLRADPGPAQRARLARPGRPRRRPDSLRTWDERLAAEAVPLIEARAEAVETLVRAGARGRSLPGPGRGGAPLPAQGRPGRRRDRRRAGPPAAMTSSAGPTPPTARSSTRSRCAPAAGRCVASARRASSGRPCSPSCSGSARR